MNGIFLQLVLNIITTFIYGYQLSKPADIDPSEEYNILFQTFNYLFRNNFLVVTLSLFILLFSLLEAYTMIKVNERYEKYKIFGTKKYYFIIILIIVIKLILAIYFIYIEKTKNNDLISNDPHNIHKKIMFLYGHVIYTSLSSLLSSIFSFVVYKIIFKFKDIQKTMKSDKFNDFLIIFCDLSNYSIFLIDWMIVPLSFYIVFGCYMLFLC
jgi:hypothetical protein